MKPYKVSLVFLFIPLSLFSRSFLLLIMESQPTQTLYINNINEKIKKNVLKKLLAMLFSQYGRVIQVTACKGLKLRGQVFIK